MASITQPRITAAGPLPHDSNVWEVTIEFDVAFRENELGLEFNDAVKLWEDDHGNIFGGGDDEIMPYPIPDTFTADDFIVSRQWNLTAFRDQLDTESGDEELKAQIWLRRADMGGPADDERFTPIFEISP
ncbi:hypothetical protein PL81_24530 [Streptomyces sp. RSD-27]|nr:hypothetical protein PL81_24530 [Streptomyces sp. RSD-27]